MSRAAYFAGAKKVKIKNRVITKRYKNMRDKS